MGKLLDEQAKNRIKREIFFESLLSVVVVVGIFILSICILTCTCFGAENKPVKKTVNQSTSNENKIRKQQFNTCVQQCGSRARCYSIYY